MPDDRSATLLVRVWLEDDDSFRARLTATGLGDGQERFEHVATAASPDDVVVAVRGWLDAVLRTGRSGHHG